MSTQRPTLGVGAICVADGSLLMVQRGRDPGRGLWSLPGGRVEQGERIEDALRREVKEETSLDIEVGGLAGVFEVIGTDRHYVVVDHFAEVVGDATPVAGGDAADARWVRFEAIPDLDCTPRLVETLTGWNALPRPR